MCDKISQTQALDETWSLPGLESAEFEVRVPVGSALGSLPGGRQHRPCALTWRVLHVCGELSSPSCNDTSPAGWGPHPYDLIYP